jgi:hypothetical protein
MNGDFKPASRRPKSWLAPEAPIKEQTAEYKKPFQTPEQVAAVTDASAEPLLATETPDTSNGTKTPAAAALGHAAAPPVASLPWYKQLRPHWPLGKKEYIELAAVIVVLGLGSWLTFFHYAQKPVVVAHTAAIKLKPKPVIPTTVPSNLTGLPVAPAINQLPVTGVMIENSIDARPQSGLGQAGVVFEAVAEGGVTRFLALFQDTSPANVGPIRSARPYYVQWAMGFDAAYAHVGGSPDALSDIKAWNVKDLDQFYNGGYYHRVTSRIAPHNVYTSIGLLNQLETAKGYTASSFTSWPRKVDAAVKQPTARTINLTLSGPDYNPSYSYNPTTNSYLRSEAGAPQMDANTNLQISPKVVVAMIVPESQGALDASGAYYSNYNSIGSGTVDVFEDGTVITGQWSKADNTTQLSFTTADGQPIKFNAGQTWVTAVSTAGAVSYTP